MRTHKTGAYARLKTAAPYLVGMSLFLMSVVGGSLVNNLSDCLGINPPEPGRNEGKVLYGCDATPHLLRERFCRASVDVQGKPTFNCFRRASLFRWEGAYGGYPLKIEDAIKAADAYCKNGTLLMNLKP